MLIRYPLESAAGIVILWLLFIGIFFGAQSISGAPISPQRLTPLVLGYCLWFFAVIMLNSVSYELMSEAAQGTLEQLALSRRPGLLTVVLLRSLTSFAFGLISVSLLLVLIMATTGIWLSFPLGQSFLLVLMSVAVLAGISLFMGGLALIFKRVGQVVALTQFLLLLVAFSPPEMLGRLSQPVKFLLPLAGGVELLSRLATVQGPVRTEEWLMMTLAALIYLAVGAILFLIAERIARRHGLLGHY